MLRRSLIVILLNGLSEESPSSSSFSFPFSCPSSSFFTSDFTMTLGGGGGWGLDVPPSAWLSWESKGSTLTVVSPGAGDTFSLIVTVWGSSSKSKGRCICDAQRSVVSCAEVAEIALTFFLDAFVPGYQSQPHHLWSCPVDLEFLQLRILLYVFFCRFRLQQKVEFVIKSWRDSSKHTEQSRSRHQRQNSYDRSAQQRVTRRNHTGLESEDVSPRHSERPTTSPHKHQRHWSS